MIIIDILAVSSLHHLQTEQISNFKADNELLGHLSTLLDHNVSLHLRMKYFDACVGPALLFGMAVLPLSRFQIQKMDILQRKMLRRIVGWRRSEGEDRNITMSRMNGRLAYASSLHFCQS